MSRRMPAPFPQIGLTASPLASTSSIASQRLVRLARQLRLLHTAVTRWVAPGALPQAEARV